MKVCILGNGLTSLTLAKALVNLDINVDIYSNEKIKNYNKNQTIGISKANTEFFNNNVLNIKKFLWNINRIEIFSDSLKDQKILKFENKQKKIFSIIRNFEVYKYLLSKLNRNKLIKFKKKFDYHNLDKNKYKLIFNCEFNNPITKKFFYKKISKNYNSSAFITIINHKKLFDNFTATQIFTKIGPIAFLPISSKETSVVYSVKSEKNIDLENLIKKYNTKYKILKINKIASIKLKSSNLRFYNYKNILAFGDLLHKVHPLAGQGFNMSVRDIKEIIKLIKIRKDNGLDLDNSIFLDFEKNTRHKNYLFSQGVDFIYEFFKLESKIKNNIFSKTVKLIGKNKIANNFFKKIADKGIVI